MNPRLSIFHQGALHLADQESVRVHSTQAAKLVLALDGELVVSSGHGCSRLKAVLVPPYTPQSIEATGLSLAFFAEPGGLCWPLGAGPRSIRALEPRELSALSAVGREVFRGRSWDDAEASREAFSLLSRPSFRVEARVERVLRRIERDLDADGDALARLAGVSPVRLRHLIFEQTGMALRTCRLWHRTLLGVEHLLAGQQRAQAAASAGFADQPHFSRTFARFFGRTLGSMHGDLWLLQPYAKRLLEERTTL